MRKISLLYLIVILLGSCKDPAPKEYFVRPCEFVCDYPFSDVNKWAVTCRVWGLLKYYHPNITSGNVDWDKVLLNRLDDIRFITTPEILNTELKKMLSAAGAYTYEKDKNWNDSLNMNRNLDWIDHSFLDEALRDELKKIASMKVQNPAYYSIGRGSSFTGRITFSNEKDQKTVNNSNLLTLFRYWNIVYYFFPYKYKMTQSWDETLTQFIPLFLEATNKSSLDIALLKLVSFIDDGHGYTSGSGPSYKESVNKIEKIGESTVSRVSHGGMERGDIILGIEGQEIQEIRDSLSVLTAASTQLAKDFYINTDIASMIFSQETDIIVSRGGRIQDLHLVPSAFERDTTRTAYSRINNHIGYVDLDVLQSDQVQSMFEYLSHTKGIIFDLRNYPKGVGCFDIIGYCIDEQKVPYLRFTIPDTEHPGAFYWSENHLYLPISSGVPKYKGEIIVLVNEYTQSWAEVNAVMFRTAVNATLIGRPTAGANGETCLIPLPDGRHTTFSAVGAYYPDRSETQRIGILPDIEVYAGMESILAGRDEVLDAAIEYLENKN